MRKIYRLFLILFSIFLLTSCGETPNPGPGPDPDPEPIPEIKEYTITWKDDEGNTLKEEKVKEDTVPSYTYDKEDTVEWDYTFKGWSKEENGTVCTPEKPSEDSTYFAVIEKAKRKYTVSFNTNGGTNVDNVEVEYNGVIEAPERPTKDGNRFVNWCTDSDLKNAVNWPLTVQNNITLYAVWNEQVDIPGYLKALLNDYKLDPYSYIPDTLKPGYSGNLVNNSNLTTDYSGFVNVSNIKSNGFGEQWHMVTDNLQQSKVFFNVLTVVEGLTTTSISAFNNYFDKNPADTASHNFKNGIYNITINFDGQEIFYILDFTTTLPVLGEQSVQIALSMNIDTREKYARIQAGEANALTYTVKEDSYTFAIKYLGLRKAYFKIERINDQVKGQIKEFLTVAGKGITSAADFYIGPKYASIVGNKASGILGFTGYISELYNVTNGKMLGYEVKETLSKIEYNTLWFNLSDVSGLTSIKYQDKNESQDEAFYVNGLASAFEARKVGGVGTKMLSRRFDIEFRKQYFYKLDASQKSYEEVAVDVPMLFVQEEYYDTFNADVKNVNKDLSFNIQMNNDDFNKLTSDYDTLIDIFIANKEAMTEEEIVSIIGNKVLFN